MNGKVPKSLYFVYDSSDRKIRKFNNEYRSCSGRVTGLEI